MRVRALLMLAMTVVLVSGCLKPGGKGPKDVAGNTDPQSTDPKVASTDPAKKDTGGGGDTSVKKTEPEVPKVASQEQAAVELRKLKPRYLEVDENAPGKPILVVDLGGKEEIGDNHLTLLKECTNLKELNLAYTNITDKGLANLKGLSSLQKLDLYHTKITDAGLPNLTALPKLAELSLDWTGVTDKGLEALKGMKQLQKLDLFRTKITDAGLASLKDMSQMKDIDCGGTEVSDKGLESLKGLKTLEGLGVHYAKVTADGAAELQKAIPKVKMRGVPPKAKEEKKE
ncbi:MAG: hypothetical protein K2R98_32530 [Gemmataceae bacterium]|nr:hypothetical protein [Gemmataceae bacterium]